MVRHTVLCHAQGRLRPMGDMVLPEREKGQQISPWRDHLCVCVCVCNPLSFGVLFLLLKQRLLSILKLTLALALSPAWPRVQPTVTTAGPSSLADIQDKEDTPLRKVRCLLKIRQNLRGCISFISRPTSINPHSRTIRAAVQGGSSDESNLPSYIEERGRRRTGFSLGLFFFFNVCFQVSSLC